MNDELVEKALGGVPVALGWLHLETYEGTTSSFFLVDIFVEIYNLT
jgi:hypothetical protein